MTSIVEQIQANLENGTVAEYSNIQIELQKLRDEIGSVIPDCTTKDGYSFSKESAQRCVTIRSNLEAIRKEKKQPYLDYGRLIDSQAKEIKAEVEAIEQPHKEAYKAVDEAKKQRLEAIKSEITTLKNSIIDYAEASESEIEKRINDIECLDLCPKKYGRLLNDVIAAQQVALEALATNHAKAINRRIEAERIEAERQELEMLRAEQAKRDAERERQERERQEAAQREKMRQEAEEAARLKVERAKAEAERQAREAKEAAEEAERQRIAAEEKAKRDAELAEQRRIEAEAKAKRDAEAAAEQARLAEIKRQEEAAAKAEAERQAREADKKHRGAINSHVMQALIAGGMNDDQAKLAVKLIAANKVPHTVINY